MPTKCPTPRKNGPPKKENALRRDKDYLYAKTKAWREANPERTKDRARADHEKRKERYRDNPALYLWKSARNRSKTLGIAFDIDPEDILVPLTCPILEIPIDILTSNYTTGASLDRVINDKGYVKGNVRVISRKANRMKQDSTIEQLEKMIAYMRGDI